MNRDMMGFKKSVVGNKNGGAEASLEYYSTISPSGVHDEAKLRIVYEKERNDMIEL